MAQTPNGLTNFIKNAKNWAVELIIFLRISTKEVLRKELNNCRIIVKGKGFNSKKKSESSGTKTVTTYLAFIFFSNIYFSGMTIRKYG